MKSKKLLLPIIFISVAVLAMVVYAVISGIAKKPTITEKDFSFSITYEFDGKTETIDSVYTAYFSGNGGYATHTDRFYNGKIAGKEENDTVYVLRDTDEERIVLYTNFYADYLLGEPDCSYFESEPFEPQIMYYDEEENEYSDENTLLQHGVKLIDWEYPEPVENTLVFARLTGMTGEVVLPFVLVAALALIAVIVFSKKEKDVTYDHLDVIGILFNFAIVFLGVPIMAVYGMLSDIVETSEALTHQIGYLAAPLSLLGVAASVALRRKGSRNIGVLVQFIAPAIFVLDLICIVIMG